MRRPHCVPELVVFDADDTLWHTEELYDEALDECERLVERHGVDPGEWRSAQRQADHSNAETMGFAADRFPLSSAQAYAALAGTGINDRIARRVQELSRSVFDRKARLVDHAPEVLKFVSSRCRTALLTKGEESVQRKRISDSGLAGMFDEIRIVRDKTPQDFASIADAAGAPYTSSVTVGNSLVSDIMPAVGIGMRGIWVEAYSWKEDEDRQKLDAELSSQLPDGVEELRSLAYVPQFLGLL